MRIFIMHLKLKNSALCFTLIKVMPKFKFEFMISYLFFKAKRPKKTKHNQYHLNRSNLPIQSNQFNLIQSNFNY